MKIQLYKGQGTQRYRWRLVAANGKTIADSAEAYATQSNLRRAVRRLLKAGLRAWVDGW